MLRSIDHPDESWIERVWKHDRDTIVWLCIYATCILVGPVIGIGAWWLWKFGFTS